jgi:cobalt-precorrin 5A hydrolase/precorrin-3B C17-methyltransferase
VVGIGPGDGQWRTPEASAALAEVEDVVGYKLYLDLLGSAITHARCHGFDLGAERDRVIRALELAAEGRAVALVSSGDAGIYALATLVFETLEDGGRGDWNRLAITVVPGISAMQAAAARAGAPLGHDFCAISLSDLLTPWTTIEARLKAAAAGDFVLALYNPASKRRTRQLAAARDILLAARKPETPVLIARNLGREGETTRVIELGELKPIDADMTTLILVGNSQTRRIPGEGQGWLYTPRGYAAKEPTPKEPTP